MHPRSSIRDLGMHETGGNELRWEIGPEPAFRGLLLLCGVVLALGVLAEIVEVGLGYPSVYGLRPRFDLDGEGTLGAYVSALMLLAAAALLAVITVAERRDGRPRWPYWALLGLGFLWMSVDEAIALHELLNRPLREILGRPAFAAAWTVAGGLIAAVAALVAMPLLRSLDPRRARLFLLAGGIYVGGAVGIEYLGGMLIEGGLRDSWIWSVELVVEEGAEMGGVALFLYALLDHLRASGRILRISLASPTAAGAAPPTDPAALRLRGGRPRRLSGIGARAATRARRRRFARDPTDQPA